MDRSLVVFGAIFLAIPLALVIGILAVPSAAFGLTVALIALLSLGFLWGIGFVDLES